MRRLAAAVLVLAAMHVGVGVACAEGDGWVVQAGYGPLYPSTTDYSFLGRSMSVSAAKPLKPWFLFGPAVEWYRLDPHESPGSIVSIRTEAWDAIVVSATFRVQPPVRVGPAPFLTASSGLSLTAGGDTYTSWYGNSYSFTYHGRKSLVWASSIGLGVRVVAPGRWPDAEFEIRRTAWIDSAVYTLFAPRFAIMF